MPWCPNCKAEYVEGIEKCAECDMDLVENMPIEQKDEYNQRLNDKEMYLTYAASEMDFNIIRSILEPEGIYVYSKEKYMGQYLKIFTGSSYAGCDVYVLESDYETAKEILGSIETVETIDENEFDVSEDEVAEDNAEQYKNETEFYLWARRIGYVLIILLLIRFLGNYIMTFILSIYYILRESVF